MKNKNDERFFQELAKAYAENEGASLKNELAQIEAEKRLLPTAGLDRKIKNSINKRKFRSVSLKALPLAASLIIAVLLFSSDRGGLNSSPSAPPASPSTPIVSEEPTPAPPLDTATMDALLSSVELVSASLPAGYTVTGVDYDNAAAIMEITNAQNNRIVLTTETYHDFDKDGFTVITVNGSAAYGLVKNDYCLLKYARDDILYTLTCMYNYGDLLDILENI